MTKWLYRISDGTILMGGMFEPSRPIQSVTNNVVTYDPDYDIVEFADSVTVNINTQRYTGSALRATTAPELATVRTAVLDAASQVTSRQKDILSMCALVVRARGIATWNAMTIPQRVTATLAEADVWKAIRIWAEDNL
jgi:hypothetical protein